MEVKIKAIETVIFYLTHRVHVFSHPFTLIIIVASRFINNVFHILTTISLHLRILLVVRFREGNEIAFVTKIVSLYVYCIHNNINMRILYNMLSVAYLQRRDKSI